MTMTARAARQDYAALIGLCLAGCALLAFAAADVNGDGLNDLVASGVTDPATQMPAFAVFLNNGDGTFGKPAYADAAGTILFTVDDVNGDGKPDIAAVNNAQFDFATFTNTRSITTLLGNGDGTFRSGVDSPTSAAGRSGRPSDGSATRTAR